MTPPMTPREKVDVREIALAAMTEMRRSGESHEMCARWISERVNTALASGSGDHAELVEDAMGALQIIDAFPSNQGEVVGHITEKGYRMLSFCTECVRPALEALLAENAALRAVPTPALVNDAVLVQQVEKSRELMVRATEAERKLAEAVELLREWIGTWFVDADSRGENAIADDTRKWLSK